MSASAPPRRLILLVDDDPLLLDYLKTVLDHAGYATVAAESAAEALQRVAEREADIALALLDISMPGMSGLDLARRLKDHTSVAFMFLSSVDDAETARQAASHGAVGFVVKPVDAARLLPAFESATRSASCAAPKRT
jgi:response regulator NasT